MNKYLNQLEKLAFLGFSKEEKQKKYNRQFHIESNNAYANHINKFLPKYNKDTEHLDVIKNKDHARQYVDGIMNHMRGDKEFISNHKKAHDTYSSKMKSIGLDIGDHETYMTNMLDSMHKEYYNHFGIK